ncbi:MAG: DUF448 domain-containing protein [Epsilonproteobacteria bacterium]|nr:DUF448 domain-containing protein [Campylobacterota bacterium]
MSDPVRMCIHCRRRFLQAQLIRLQCENNHLRPFRGQGRSFYLCTSCIDEPKLRKRMAKLCGNREYATTDLGKTIRGLVKSPEFKETAANGQSTNQ